jgi:hypothetical protein
MLIGYMVEFLHEKNILTKSPSGEVAILQSADEMYKDLLDAIKKIK